MKKIVTGDLTERIQIMMLDNVDDDAGGTIPNEVVYWETWAMVTPYKSNNYMQANQDILKDGFSFIVRYRSDKSIQPDMRIKWKGEYLALTSAPTDFVYKEWLQIKATWVERPDAIPTPTEATIYFGTSDTGAELTIEDVMSGTAIPYNEAAGIIAEFSNEDYLFNWIWIPDGIELPNRYQNMNFQDDYGDIGTDQDLFNEFYVVGDGSVSMTNYEIPITDPFLFTKE